MQEIHCHNCGGFITDATRVSYQSPSSTAAVTPHGALCPCIPSVVYGPPPGYLAWPGLTTLSRIERSKVAASN